MRRSLFSIVLIALLTVMPHDAFPQSQTTVPRVFAGMAIRLVIPTGYCLMDRESPQGRLYYALQEKGNENVNVVAAIFAECNEWATRQANPSYRIRRYGSYLFQLTDGIERLYPEYTLETFVQEIANMEATAQGLGTNTSIDNLNQIINKKIKESDIKTATSVGPINVGLIAVEKYAVFYGMGSTVNYTTESPRISAVIASMLVNGIPATINLYDDYSQSEIFSRLLNEQKQNAERFVKANLAR